MNNSLNNSHILSFKGLGINKISHHPEMLPGNLLPGIGAG